MEQLKVYDLDNLPEDAVVGTGSKTKFEPIDPAQIYQVEITKAELVNNPYFDEKKNEGSKYQINFEFAILHEGEFYGRRLWKKTSLSLMPTTKKGEPTNLYKIVSSALKATFSWDDCASFGGDIKTLMTNLVNKVVGKQVKVSVENVTNPETKKTRTNIKSFYEVKEDLPSFDLEKSKNMGEKIKSNKSLDDLDEIIGNISEADLDPTPKKKKK